MWAKGARGRGYVHILGLKVTTTSVGSPPDMLGLGARGARGSKGVRVCTYIRFKVTTTSVGARGEGLRGSKGGERARGGARGSEGGQGGARGSEGMLY